MCSAARWKPRREPNRPGRAAVSVARRIPGVGRAPDDRSGPRRAPLAMEKGDHSERQLPGRHQRRAARRTAGPPRRCHVRVTVHADPARLGSAWRRAMTMPNGRPPATVRATPEPPWPGPRSCAGGGISSAPGRQVRSSCSPLPGNTWIVDSAPANGSVWLHMPGTPWSMRLANGSGGRPALEIHAGGSLIDVMVASSPASQLLRGACTMTVARHPHAIAWGCLPTARSELPSVEFIRGRIRHRAQPVEAESVAGWFWFADAGGRFSQVVATSQESRESCRIRTVDAC